MNSLLAANRSASRRYDVTMHLPRGHRAAYRLTIYDDARINASIADAY